MTSTLPETHGPDQRGRTPLDSAQRGGGGYVWRFNRFHRITHALAIVTFYVLVSTGLPLRFPEAPWAAPAMSLIGGVERAGILHRIAGALTLIYGTIHFVYVGLQIARAPSRKALLWGPDSLVPQPRDVVDFVRQWRWMFGLGPRPAFARYSYMEKLDYWGEIWGFVVIGGSGLLLWFPVFFGQILPGWIFNVATIFHGYEALIAICFLFAVHFFNVHLRPDKFPMDAVMFTGRATVHYMEEEHPEIADSIRRHAHLPPSGDDQRPDLPAPAPGPRTTFVAALFGHLALASGLAVIGMILWALIS